MTALEVLIDEAATALRLDPIEFRRRNALPTNGKTMVGNVLDGVTRTGEILDKLAKHAIWTDRAAEKARTQQQAGILVGTGVACVTKDFGTGADARLSSVEITPQGRIAIHCECRRDGDRHRDGDRQSRSGDHRRRGRRSRAGAGRRLCAARSSSLPAIPTRSRRQTQDAASRNPRWVPEINSPSSASVGRDDQHACRIRGRARRLPLRSVAGRARAVGHCEDRSARPAMGHRAVAGTQAGDARVATAGFGGDRREGACARRRHRGDGARLQSLGWSNASFTVAGETWTADIDALAVRTGTGTAKAGSAASSADRFVRLNRTRITIPPAVNQRFGSAYPSRPAGRWSASRSSARPARCASPRRTASSNAGNAGARSRRRPGAGRLCDGRRPGVARDAAAL